MSTNTLTRRDIIRQAVLGLAATGIAPYINAETNAGGIPLRTLGHTGEKVPMLALGGHHIGRIKDDAESIRLIRQAIDRGVTFLDNAWCYHDGRSEVLMGNALRDGYRKKVFLMTKVHGRDKQGALKHLEESLKRFHTDVIDLWQFHDIREEDPDKIFAPGGAVEAAEEAKKAGKIRYVGFTGHNNYLWHRRMLDFEYKWDAVQMPINALDPHFRSFRKNIVPILVERNIGVIAMKTMAAGDMLKTGVVDVNEGLRYIWSQPISTAVSGMASVEHLEANIKSAQNFKPMTEREQEALLNKTRQYALTGEYETFKAKS
ncbi:MAG: aldo/keto reductase [Candidatus Latescibacteria bacterium]|nr:aldo/keto reductase [Candidatus Latescibacterota bacterium]